MTSATDQARRYLTPAAGAVSGNNGHSDTFGVACCLVQGFGLSIEEARPIMEEWNSRCQPPWSSKELEHKLKDAERQPPPPEGRGHKVRRGVSYVFGDSSRPVTTHTTNRVPEPVVKSKAYNLSERTEIPSPIQDGTRELLKAAFLPGEGIRIEKAIKNDSGKEIPKDSGIVLSLEAWLEKLEAKNGNFDKILTSAQKNGTYISVNPMQVGGSKDSDVTAFRHVLAEWDEISKEEQWNILVQSNIPCTAVIDSGGKSIHAWVRIDAQDRDEFKERAKVIYDHFEISGVKIDGNNKNPSRFSRLAGCDRGEKRQELLALHIGAVSYTEWLKELQDDKLGPCHRVSELWNIDTKNDPSCVIGFHNGKSTRYLCKGKSAWIVGPSGVGKSSLITKFAVGWALNLEVFGIVPAKALKSLIVQAENDENDLAEMVQGVILAHGIDPFSPEFDAINENVIFKTDSTRIGPMFLDWLHRLIDRERPDIVWIDPLLSFAGIDVNKQEAVSAFLRQGVNKVMEATGVVIIGIHHTGKPKRTNRDEPMSALDYAYMGLGSSELVNWARAVLTLVPFPGDQQFKLMLAKRGTRAGAKHPDGSYTPLAIYLEHSKTGISWTQIAPEDIADKGDDNKPRKEKKKSKVDMIAFGNVADFLMGCLEDGEAANVIEQRLEDWTEGQKGMAACKSTCRSAIVKMVDNGKLVKKKRKFFKGENA